MKQDNEILRYTFAEWASRKRLSLVRKVNGDYNSPKTQTAWEAFKAGFALLG